MKIKEAIQHLQTYNEEMTVAISLWQPYDIIERVMALSLPSTELKENQIESILQKLESKMPNSDVWLMIDCLIEEELNPS